MTSSSDLCSECWHSRMLCLDIVVEINDCDLKSDLCLCKEVHRTAPASMACSNEVAMRCLRVLQTVLLKVMFTHLASLWIASYWFFTTGFK